MKAVWPATVGAVVLVSGAASASNVSGHAAYAPGLSIGYAHGFRHQLDAGVIVDLGNRQKASEGTWSHTSGLLLGGAASTAFAAAPTYGFVEAGWGTDTTLAGLGFVGGPALRFADVMGGGVTGRVAADFYFVQVGIRITAVFIGEREGQACLTVGIGRF
jgi:hypothetical protein